MIAKFTVVTDEEDLEVIQREIKDYVEDGITGASLDEDDVVASFDDNNKVLVSVNLDDSIDEAEVIDAIIDGDTSDYDFEIYGEDIEVER